MGGGHRVEVGGGGGGEVTGLKWRGRGHRVEVWGEVTGSSKIV